MWGGSSSRGTGEPCLGDTGELSLRAYGGFDGEHPASAARSGAECVKDHSFIFVYKRLSYATNDRNMLTSNKEKCPLIWRTININTSVYRAAE